MAGGEVVGQASIIIEPDVRNFQNKLQAALSAVGSQRPPDVQIGVETGAARQALEQAIPKSKSIAVNATGLDAITNEISKIGQRLASIAGGIGGIGGALGVGAAVFGVKSLVSSVENLFDPLEKARIGFKAILGEGAGEKFLQQIRQFAKVTPFETQPLVQYSQRLLGIGTAAKDIIPLLTNVGNLVTAKGGDNNTIQQVLNALTQIKAVGRLTGQDALQLQSALINPYQLIADQTGSTLQAVRKLSEQGKITADQVFSAVSQAGTKFAGAMEANTRTISGAISVLSDTVKIFLQDNLRPIFDVFITTISDIANTFATKIPEIQATARSLFATLKPIAQAVLDAFKDIATVVGTVVGAAFKTLGPVVAALTKFLAEHSEIVKALALAYFAVKVLDFVNGLRLSAIALAEDTALKIRNIGVTKELAAANLAAVNAKRGIVGAAGAAKATGQLELPGFEATGATGAAAAAQAANAVTGIARLKSALTSIGPAAAITLGTIATQSNNATVKIAGTVAQFAGLGAAFGPQGALIGAGVGLVFGLISKGAEEAKKKLKELQDQAQKTADVLNAAFVADVKAKQTKEGASFLDQTGDVFAQTGTLDEQLRSAQAVIEKRDALVKASKLKYSRGSIESDASAANRAQAARDLLALPSNEELTKQLLGIQDQRKLLNAGLVKDTISQSTAIAAAINSANQKTKDALLGAVATRGGRGADRAATEVTVDQETGQLKGLNAEVFKLYEQKLKSAGLSIVSAGDFDKITGINAAVMAFTTSVVSLTEKYDLAKAASARFSKESLVGVQATFDLSSAIRSFTTDLPFSSDNFGVWSEKITTDAVNAAAAAQASGGSVSETLVNLGNQALIAAKAAGASNDQISYLNNLLISIGAKAHIDIVITADVQAALDNLQLVKDQIKSLPANLRGEGQDQLQTAQNAVKASRDAQAAAADAANRISTAANSIPAAKEKKLALTGVEKLQESVESIADKIRAAGEDFKSKLAEAGKQLVSDLFSSVQFNTSKSAAGLTRNANKQTDFLEQNQKFLADLAARGLSQNAISALGLTGGVQDFKRLRKLDASTTDELAALSAAVDKRKGASERSAESAKASIWAIEFRKVLADLFNQGFTTGNGNGTATDAAAAFASGASATGVDANALAQNLVDAVTSELRRKGTRR